MNADTNPLARSTPSRRMMLKASGAAALATLVGTSATTAVARAAAAPADYDAIIIGGGLAGLTAARELRLKGLRPLILEARSRLGGRTWTNTLAGERIELGGSWVAETQSNVLRELKKYNIPLITEEFPTRCVLPSPNGTIREFGVDEFFTRQSEVLTPLFAGSRDYFPNPYSPLDRANLLADLDRLTLRDRITQLGYNAEQQSWISGLTGGYSGGASTRGAFTAMAHWWALSGHTFDGFNSLNSFRPSTGTVGLLTAILNESQAQVRLSSPVKSVVRSSTNVVVTTRSGEVFTAPIAVVAMPANLWNTVTFSPNLPSAFTEVANAGMAVPNAKKVWMQVRGVTGQVYAQGLEGYPLSLVLTHAQQGSNQIMLGISVDPSLDVNNTPSMQTALRRLLPTAEVLAVKGQDWGTDEFSRGGWTFRRPLQLTTKLTAIQQPQGRVAFATSDIANGWAGYMDGAIESGATAAAQVAPLARAGVLTAS